MNLEDLPVLNYDEFGLKTYNPKVMELSMFCNSMTLSTTMPENQKLDLLMKLKDLGLEIP